MKALVPLLCVFSMCRHVVPYHVRCHCILSAGQEDLKHLDDSSAVERVDTQSGASPRVDEGSQSPTAMENTGTAPVTRPIRTSDHHHQQPHVIVVMNTNY